MEKENESLSLEDQANYDAYQSSLADEQELRCLGECDWENIIDQYDGTR